MAGVTVATQSSTRVPTTGVQVVATPRWSVKVAVCAAATSTASEKYSLKLAVVSIAVAEVTVPVISEK
jgi:hypothetical protein